MKAAVTRELEVVLTRFEPLNRFNDQVFHNKLVQEYGAAILSLIPKTTGSWFDQYIIPMDATVRKSISDQMSSLSGTMSVEVDGVTVNGSSLLLYTILKGHISLFHSLSDLEDEVHVTEMEIENGVSKIYEIEQEFDEEVTNMAVDNAAVGVMDSVVSKVEKDAPSHSRIIRTGDPSHCVDLLAKDSVTVTCFDDLYKDVQKVDKFLTNDRITGIIEVLKRTNRVGPIPKIAHFADTRFNKLADMFETIQQQQPLLSILEYSDEYAEYYSSQTTKKKEEYDAVLRMINKDFWAKIKIGIQWFKPIKISQKTVSSNSFPLSAYLPLVQALRNAFNLALREADELD
jgi:hypothetical protein